MKFRFLVICLVTLSFVSTAQVVVPLFGKITCLKGYVQEISGENIRYNSVLPDVAKVALLTRCTDGKKTIDWETEVIPENPGGKYIYFGWIAAHSKGTSSGDRNFDLYINDCFSLTFKTLAKKNLPHWSFKGKKGEQLVFDWKMDDACGDAHGYMYLRVPAALYEKGKPLKLKVVGRQENSADWYMTFKYEFNESVEIEPVPLLTQDKRQVLNVVAIHFGNQVPLTLLVDNAEKYRFILKNGANNFDIFHDAVSSETLINVKAFILGQSVREFNLNLKPVMQREIYLIHHSHYDVGYSHRQQEVEKIQNRNIANALQYISQTGDLPIEAQFKWNIETSMAVENFLKVCSPEQKADLITAVKNGRIGIGALYAGITTGLCQPEELFMLTGYSGKLEKDFGISLPAAMITDIPGLTWGTIPALARSGIRYFSDGPNYVESYPDGGDRVGHSNKNWSDRPFWWVSPSGNEKILFWMAGKGYSSWHGMKAGDIYSRGKKKIAAYMNELDAAGYPYEMVQWRYSIVADNGPTDSLISGFVAGWNAKYNSPKIILSTIDGMFREFERRYGDQLPAFSGDFTPYWEDGAYSTAACMAMNRVNSEKLTQVSNLYSIKGSPAYPADDIAKAWEKILLFDEHTWGAYNSITNPDIPFVKDQWEFKKQFALDADSLVKYLYNPFILPDRTQTFDVLNTLSWPRTDVVYIDSAAASSSDVVVDDSGREVISQKLNDGRLAFLASDIPSLGSRSYSLGKKECRSEGSWSDHVAGQMENEFFRLKIDTITGCISSLIWKPLQFELVKSGNGEGLNKFLYVPGLDPEYAVSNDPSGEIRLKENGPLLAVVQIRNTAPGCHSLIREITIVKGINRLELANTIDKKPIREKESVHFSFPFSMNSAVTRYNTGWGGIFQPGVNQLPGSNQDYYCVQHWCDISDQQCGVSLLLREACLIEPGDLTDETPGKFGVKVWKSKPDTNPTLVSYVMNNYWHTNFKADQEGTVTFHYALIPHGLFNLPETQRAGLSFNQPLLTIPTERMTPAGSLFTLSNHNVIVTSLSREDQGLSVRIFNTGEAPERFTIVPGSLRIEKLKIKSPDGETVLRPIEQPLDIPGFGIMEVILL